MADWQPQLILPCLSVLVLEHISSSWSLAGASQVRPYFTFRDELTAKACRESDGKSMVVLRGDRVVIPAALQAQILAQAHEAHAGAQKMKNTIRAYAYWPGYSRDIDEYVRQCEACTVFQTAPNRPPVMPIASAVSSPYEQISVDLTGPSESLHGCTLLTIIDYFSRYPEAYILTRGELLRLSTVFASLCSNGLPRTID